MTFKIIENRSPFESQTFRSFLNSLTGGRGGLIEGLDLNQEDKVNSGTDVLKISPGTLVFFGEIITISSTITIQNIYQKTSDGDFIFIKNPSGDPSFTSMQIGWGKVEKNSNSIILAYRKNGLWHREMNVIINTELFGRDWFNIKHNSNSNITQIDLFPTDAFFDGVNLFDGSTNFDGVV